MPKISKRYRAELILLLVTVLWGATFSIIKESLKDISTMMFIVFRFSLAGIILLPVLYKVKGKINSDSIKAGIILGILNFLAFASQTIGLKFTSATKSAFITGSAVIMAPALQIAVEKKPPAKGVILGSIIVLLGLLFLSSGGSSISGFINDLGADFNIGDALTLICAFTYALYIVYLDIAARRHEFWALLIFQIFTTGVLALAASFVFSTMELEPVRINFSRYLIFGIIYTGIFTTLLTTALLTKYQKEITPAKAGIIYSFEPLFAAFFAFIILGEQLNLTGFIGAGLIFTGLIVSEITDKFPNKNLSK